MTSGGAAVAPRRGNLVAASSDPEPVFYVKRGGQVAGQTQSGAEPSTTKLNATAGWLSGSGGWRSVATHDFDVDRERVVGTVVRRASCSTATRRSSPSVA